jgi:hypothetical protein
MSSQLRPSKVAHHINKYTKPERHCSCCKQPNHTINNCTDSRIYDLQLECENKILTLRSEISYRYWLTHYTDPIVAKALCLNLGLVRTATQVNTKHKVIETLLENYWHFEERQRQHNDVVRQIETLEFQRNLLAEIMGQDMGQDIGQEEEEEVPDSYLEQEDSRAFMIGVCHKEYDQLCKKFNITTFECPVCQENKNESPDKTFNIYDCGHQICTDCFKKTLKSLPKHKDPNCALCRNPIKKITAPTDAESTILFEIVLGLAL